MAKTDEKIIFGADTRRHPFQATAQHRGWARSVPVVLEKGTLSDDTSGPCTPASTGCFAFTTPLRAVDADDQPGNENLCSSFALYDEPSLYQTSLCTAFLVAPNLVLTAGHCVDDISTAGGLACDDMAFVFGFEEESSGATNQSFARNDVYWCKRVIDSRDDDAVVATYPADQPLEPGLIKDWAVIELDRPVSGRAPLPFRRRGNRLAPSDSTSHPGVVGIGYPLGVSQRIDGSAEIFFPHQQSDRGSGGGPVAVPGVTATYEASFDGLDGNSGGPLIDAASGVVEGIFVMDAVSFNRATVGGAERSFAMEYDAANACVRERVCTDSSWGPANVCPSHPSGFSYVGGTWAQAVTQAAAATPAHTSRRDADRDGNEDLVDLFVDPSSGSFDIVYETGTGDIGIVSPPGTATFATGTGVLTSTAQVALANIDGAGDLDIVVLVNGLIYVQRNLGGSFTQAQVHSQYGTTPTYRSFRIADVNGDGFEDVEASTNPIDVYYGSSTGLVRGERMQGFPTMYADDGKAVTVAGSAFSTIENEEFLAYVQITGQTPVMHVEVFDGDIAEGFRDGDWRRNAGGTCYQLRADTNVDGDFETLVAQRFSEGMPDGEWTTLFTGNPAVAPANAGRRGPSYEYAVRAFVATGCDQAPSTGLEVLNSFKVRANGNVFLQGVSASFMAADSSGDFTSPQAANLNTRDTTYDGRFELQVPISQANSGEARFHDFDADKLSDPEYPGVATGANDAIFYEILNGANVATREDDVSGNYDVSAGDLGTNLVVYPLTAGAAQTLRWRWQNVLTENNVYVFAPPASPVTYRLFGEGSQIRHIPTTSARTRQQWLDAWTEIGQYLPLTLGAVTPEGVAYGSSVVISNVLDAKSVLVGLGVPFALHLCTPEYNELIAEELGAKLNLLRTAALGEPLATAGIYGRDATVDEVMAQAALSIQGRCESRVCAPLDFDPIGWKATYGTFFGMMRALHGPLWTVKYKLAMTAYITKVAIPTTPGLVDVARLDFMNDTYGWLLFSKLGWTWRSKVTLPPQVLRNDASLVDQSRLLRAVNVADTTYLQTEAPPIILF